MRAPECITYEELEEERDRLRLVLRQIVLLDNDAHPGLSTWLEFRQAAHREAESLLGIEHKRKAGTP